ncbi:MAG: hypothetical protein K0S23_3466 [Fluviicola sp.]|jgi:hypothetical protein|uniref:hypothetical protein n=1 Tax=Fluviicola sp. TaxID=1917219 RepID=UPI002613FDAA|nr:hypothetical protein [Fluviicola sp.]MDF3029159.1 hypothetical protein [Fluviicola sp.]
MKKLIYSSFTVLFVLLLFTSCKKEVTNRQGHSTKSTIDGKWSVVRVYGGIAGADENHPVGEIEWTFNSQNGTLTVNNTTGNSVYYYLPAGTYSFQEISNASQNYLVIDANELGQFVISGNQMLIDENKKSTGEGACGFYLVLER